MFSAQFIKIGCGNGELVGIESHFTRLPAMHRHQLEKTGDKHPCMVPYIAIPFVRLIPCHFRVDGNQQVADTVLQHLLQTGIVFHMHHPIQHLPPSIQQAFLPVGCAKHRTILQYIPKQAGERFVDGFFYNIVGKRGITDGEQRRTLFNRKSTVI